MRTSRRGGSPRLISRSTSGGKARRLRRHGRIRLWRTAGCTFAIARFCGVTTFAIPSRNDRGFMSASLGVIVASVREGRRGETYARWIHALLAERPDVTAEFIDLRDWPLGNYS